MSLLLLVQAAVGNDVTWAVGSGCVVFCGAGVGSCEEWKIKGALSFFTLEGNRSCVGCRVSELKRLSLPPTSKERAGVKDINVPMHQNKQLENKARSWTCRAGWLKDSTASTINCKPVFLQNARQRCVKLDGYRRATDMWMRLKDVDQGFQSREGKTAISPDERGEERDREKERKENGTDEQASCFCLQQQSVMVLCLDGYPYSSCTGCANFIQFRHGMLGFRKIQHEIARMNHRLRPATLMQFVWPKLFTTCLCFCPIDAQKHELPTQFMALACHYRAFLPR